MPKENKLTTVSIKLSWLCFTCLVFAGLLKLAHWQYTRAIEKEQRLVHIEQLQQKSPITLAQVEKLANKPNENINDLPVFISAQLNNKLIFLLDNQVHQGQLGYRVLQVATTKQHAVLLNLGWVKGSLDRSELPLLPSLPKTINIKGHVRLVELGISLAEQDYSNTSWPLRIQQIELDKIAELINDSIGVPLLPFVIYIDKSETIGYIKNWQPIVMPPEKHIGYAVQWLSLAIAWLLLMAWVSGILRYLLTLFSPKTTKYHKAEYGHSLSKK